MVTIDLDGKEHLEEIIRKCDICFVSMVDTEGYPYVIPMNFGYKDGIVYMHSAPEGSSIKALNMNPNVCIAFCPDAKLDYMHEQVACSYRMKSKSVLCRGKVVFPEDSEDKIKALNILMKHYSDREFEYSDPAIKNVKVWSVEIESMTGKEFGAPNPRRVR
ncbi:pyridoxamine 5'-phosphate oxidase family protein [Dysgonomonas sp. 520]|uniref:pyridoxamine 5'-phosphate oxidase family protein n=1 Tax=Dysgonomonas sp. 520 TaxID=2302931 RepID=UPI0013D11EE7|nr:pyridoxamine 5'-phosphate oxidase family protein [Dysgonomonas sp. 520]NDW10394.1 pyridoxamine 5'-phosphate oxidase family protein [Dysgonomonas sp. 520]